MDAIWFGSRLYIVYTRAVIVVKIRASSHRQSRMSSEGDTLLKMHTEIIIRSRGGLKVLSLNTEHKS